MMDIILHDDLNVSVLLSSQTLVNQKMVTGDMGFVTTDEYSEMPMGGEVKDPLLSSWPFVIGISMVSLVVSVAIGILLAKRKIKKGFELYED
ncbi:MAG: hypothetical protein ACK5JH_12575 [Anaerocolumna sp.]